MSRELRPSFNQIFRMHHLQRSQTKTSPPESLHKIRKSCYRPKTTSDAPFSIPSLDCG